jgi:hypothetical protein
MTKPRTVRRSSAVTGRRLPPTIWADAEEPADRLYRELGLDRHSAKGDSGPYLIALQQHPACDSRTTTPVYYTARGTAPVPPVAARRTAAASPAASTRRLRGAATDYATRRTLNTTSTPAQRRHSNGRLVSGASADQAVLEGHTILPLCIEPSLVSASPVSWVPVNHCLYQIKMPLSYHPTLAWTVLVYSTSRPVSLIA